MRVLVVGGGGREHALAWKIAQSPVLTKLFIAPGNPGTESLGENVAIQADNIPALVAFAQEHKIDLVVPGPETPLAFGIADALAETGIACFGPSRAAAKLESSKRFTKEICDQAGIPTAAWASFTDAAAARAYLAAHSAPIVVKADGLAAGKGVVVAETQAEAEVAVAAMLEAGIHGASGAEIVIEECLTGAEISLFALCDGETALFCGAAADHKRVGEGDTGPNTGGMGAVAPPPAATQPIIDAAMAKIIRPALAAMARRGTPFRGFLFAGLMLTATGPKLIEFNVRFGDPECEALMPLLGTDLLPILAAAAAGKLDPSAELVWCGGAAATIILAAKGYPGAHEKGGPIDLANAGNLPGIELFHAGTARQGATLVSTGGRVLAVTATGADLPAAIGSAYRAVDAIGFPGGFCRRDIGAKALPI
ncbi:phosphoribosylamine--glycine ligase [Acidiphilium sp. AL]|uniref:Phosphoribosylamine--glycine ligase n=1 Tax=Acidiphilium iwatense TaxID=768198 RepID=A0ABS9DW99_9PROT|nr:MULTISPECIES: phosphoribosylamine--glycine ligase [Acidiphilium]MCF3947011.1 phosphoribosylamine--glycine ligase [Acidiphilium iwatense]MCU4160313.1 phosphoribosylamine--glycine ligase [Acidiphilium sp. AL]